MFVLCLSFVLIFTVFRSIQNLQSSMNKEYKLGIVAMCCVYTVMFLTCPLVPYFNNRLGSKWSIVIGMTFYHFWIAANFYPHFYTLIPTSVAVGLGQSMAWTGQVSYMSKLTADYSSSADEVSEYDIYRFNGIFLAFFQTTHIWGNLVSSLMLYVIPPNVTMTDDVINGSTALSVTKIASMADGQQDSVAEDALCGVWDDCTPELSDISQGFTRSKYIYFVSNLFFCL